MMGRRESKALRIRICCTFLDKDASSSPRHIATLALCARHGEGDNLFDMLKTQCQHDQTIHP